MTNEQLLPIIHKVMDKLMNLGGADYDSDKNTSKEQSDQGLIARDFGIEEWDWPKGVGLYGLYKLQNFYGDNRYLDFFENASKKCMVEVLLIIVVTDGFPQQAVHLLRKGITVSTPDSLE